MYVPLLPLKAGIAQHGLPPLAIPAVSCFRGRSPVHELLFGRLYAAGAQVPHYIRAERLYGDVRAVWHVSRIVSDMH